MKNKKKLTYFLGVICIASSVFSFFFGVAMFTATNTNYPDWVYTLAEYCFIGWFPLGILGIILIKHGKNNKNFN